VRGLPYQGNHDYCLSLPNFVEIRDGTSNEWRWKCVKDLAGALGSYWYDFGNLVLERMVNMTEIKLEVGRRYPTRNGGTTKIRHHDESIERFCFCDEYGVGYTSDGRADRFAHPLDIIGQAIKEPEPQKFRDTIHPNNWKMPKIDPNDRPVELGWYVAGEEWEVVGWIDKKNNDAFAIKPKPKRLSGFVHVYENPYGDRKGYMLWDGVGDMCPGTKELARIDLSDFEEGYGL